MIKKIFFIVIVGMVAHTYSMDDDIQPWVRTTDIIIVRTTDQSYNIFINPDATVLDVKKTFQQQEGIAPDDQALQAEWREQSKLYYGKKFSPSLQDSLLIKQAMNMYSTTEFRLHLNSTSSSSDDSSEE